MFASSSPTIIAYLTFDDGPTPVVTPKILDILKEENIKATFFVLGKSVDAHPEIVKRTYEEGHYIANHGYSHNNSILYKDSTKNEEAAEKMKITAEDLKELEIIDEIIKEPKGGAQKNPEEIYKVLQKNLLKNLKALKQIESNTLIEQRYNKFRTIGQKYIILKENNI